MESPRSHQELNPQSITDQYTNQQFPDIPVDNLQVAKSSENSNPQDLRVNPELRNNNTPNQEGNDLIEIPVPHKESAEEALQQSPKSPKQDKIEADNGSAAISPGQENVNNAKYEVKVNENAESVKDSLNQAINVIRGEENQTSSSTHEEKTLKINVVNVTEETNEAVKSESPPNGSRLKDRSPNLKLLIVTNQNIGGPLNSFESNEASNIESGVVGANIKKCHSSSEIPATEGENPNKQSESPGTMKKNASTNSLVVKEEENKAEPVSASPSRPKLSMEDFHKITSVGKGSYGEVFLVKKISNNKLYALKAIDKNFMKKEKKEHQVYVEREVLLKLNHPNIIRLYSSFQDKLKLYFVLEYVGGGEFSDYLRVHGKLSKDQIIFFAAEIVNILEYLHDCGIAHRDMKPENLLLTPEGHLKCIDFGTAKFLATEKRSAELFTKNDAADANGEAKPAPRRAHRSTFVGTAQYVSPEMLEGSDCGAAADLWAFGCMIYLMAVGQFPFADSNEYLIFQKIKAVTVTYPEDMDLEIKDLIQKLLVKDPIMRLGAGEKGSKNDYEGLKAHSLFRGIDFAKLHEQKPPLVEIASPHKRRSHDFEPAGLASNQQQARKHFHSDDLSRQENKDTKAVEFPTDKAIRVILSGLVLKKTGWLFYRPRQLILNSKPRLVYYDPDSNQLKGEITLAPTTKAELESKTKFTITTPTKKFVFKEMEHSAEKWVEIVNTAVQQLYAKKPEK